MDKLNKQLLDKLIVEANEKADADGEIYFIFSESTAYIHDKRETAINDIVGNQNEFYISDMTEYLSCPSREFIYDTYTKELNKFKRRDMIFSLITRIGFEAMPVIISSTEQSFILSVNSFDVKLILQKNLFFTMLVINVDDNNRMEHTGFLTFSNILEGFTRYNSHNKKNTFDIQRMKRNYNIKSIV